MTTSSTGNNQPGRGAFTLIEVLVTVVILFAGVAVVLRCYAGAIRGLDAAERTVKADQYMGLRMAEAELSALQGDVPGSDGGACAAPLGGYAWDRRAAATSLTHSDKLAEVVVTLRDSKSSDQHAIASEFIVRQP